MWILDRLKSFGSTRARAVAASVIEARKSGRFSGQRLLELLYAKRQELYAIIETDPEIASLRLHPGWLKLRDRLVNRIEDLSREEHDLFMSDPEVATLNWFEQEALVTLVGIVDETIAEDDHARRVLEVFGRFELESTNKE